MLKLLFTIMRLHYQNLIEAIVTYQTNTIHTYYLENLGGLTVCDSPNLSPHTTISIYSIFVPSL